MKSFKVSVHNTCISFLNERISSVKQSIKEAEESIHENTKSSMGDKYENSREMATLEIDKRQAALNNLLSLQNDFQQINPEIKTKRIEKGSLLATNKALFYIAGSLGRVEVEGKSVMVISQNAPIFQTLKGFDNEKKVIFNGSEYELIELM